jgi:hypothetical protein
LLDLQVAAIHLVIVCDHDSGEFYVLVGDGLEHAIELPGDEVQASERLFFKLPKRLVEMMTNLVWH